MRILAYEVFVDFMDEYMQITKSTSIKNLKYFVKANVAVFNEEHLKSPNNNDITRLLVVGEHHDFHGMLGSIVYMYCKWNNCPTARYNMYSGHVHELMIILGVVASYDL
jgi:hypothetical protein